MKQVKSRSRHRSFQVMVQSSPSSVKSSHDLNDLTSHFTVMTSSLIAAQVHIINISVVAS